MKNRARDPHDVLGVAEGAEIDEIKKQFRARAKALHPDTSDGTASEDAFHELKAAYETLLERRGAESDPQDEVYGPGMSARLNAARAWRERRARDFEAIRAEAPNFSEGSEEEKRLREKTTLRCPTCRAPTTEDDARRCERAAARTRRESSTVHEDDDEGPKKKKKKRREAEDEELTADEEDDALSEAASGADVVAGAAFGGGAKNSCRTLSIASDTDDGASETSSRARAAHCRAFPIPNETCVGCALPAKVGPVDEFVRTNCDKMKEDALFKMAALVYLQKVVDPAEAEQVPVPHWPWKDIRSHYTMHRMDVKMQRYENMRTLAAMRKTLELSLLKEDEDADGNRVHTLDKGNAEQIMKIITLQSREITLLHEAGSAAGKPGGKKP